MARLVKHAAGYQTDLEKSWCFSPCCSIAWDTWSSRSSQSERCSAGQLSSSLWQRATQSSSDRRSRCILAESYPVSMLEIRRVRRKPDAESIQWRAVKRPGAALGRAAGTVEITLARKRGDVQVKDGGQRNFYCAIRVERTRRTTRQSPPWKLMGIIDWPEPAKPDIMHARRRIT